MESLIRLRENVVGVEPYIVPQRGQNFGVTTSFIGGTV